MRLYKCMVQVSFICVISYALNFWLCSYVVGAYDNVGGSCIIHLFGACFGIGVSYIYPYLQI